MKKRRKPDCVAYSLGLNRQTLLDGYNRSYRNFYSWKNITRASLQHQSLKHQAKHFAYAAGWKKFEPVWDTVIRAKQLRTMTPLLEGVLSKVTGKSKNYDSTLNPVELSKDFEKAPCTEGEKCTQVKPIIFHSKKD